MKFRRLLTSFLALVVVLAGCSTNQTPNAKQSDEVVIYIVRHGKTMLNTIDRSQGWIDAPLTPAGIEVAECLGRGFKAENIQFDQVYTSTSGRTIETAETILSQMGQADLMRDSIKMAEFREFNFGTFEGMPNSDMIKAVADDLGITPEEWQANHDAIGFAKSIAEFSDALSKLDVSRVEDGINWPAENHETIVNRLTSGLNKLIEEAIANNKKQVLLVSHGMSIATLLATLDPQAPIPSNGLKNASVSKIIYKDGQYTIESVNDLSYIEKGKQ